MKYLLMLTLVFITFQVNLFSQDTVKSRFMTTMVNTEIDSVKNEILLNMEGNNGTRDGYRIAKKQIGESKFKTQVNNYHDDIWLDANVKNGIAYEYEVRNNNMYFFENNPFTYIYPLGYITSGINVEGYTKKRTVLILVDSTVYEPLKPEIERLREDLIYEGWGVRIGQAQRVEEYDVVYDIDHILNTYHSGIREHYLNKDVNLEAVVLIGRIARIYSGNFSPDNNNNHEGAWPSDGFWGIQQDYFSDSKNILNTNSNWERNHNTPDDHKFSYNKFPYQVELQIGRIDMFNLPSFEESEIELLRRYLDKNHKYRTGQMNINRRGLIDDNLPAYKDSIGYASSGWMNFGNLFGKENVEEADFFTTLENETYLSAYACGKGQPFDSLEGVGSTRNFVNQPVNAVFTMLFGDYIGDWDSPDNMMRAALASEPSILTCSWAGSPHWYMHHMGIGYPIGYSTRFTQNNTDYERTVFFDFSTDTAETYTLDNYKRGVHTALMGDPTLTMYPLAEEKTAKNLKVEKLDDNKVRLTWDLPEGNELYYYDVFRATHEYGPFEKVNEYHIMAGTYEDEFNYKGKVWYMVRKKVIERSPTATFWKHLRGNMVDVELTANSVEYTYNYFNFTAEPNPANEQIKFKFHLLNPAFTKLEIYNQQGQLIKTQVSKHLNKGNSTFNWNLTNESGTKVPSGIYIAKLTAGDKAEVRKVVVVR